MTPTPHSGNQLLASMPFADFDALRPHLRLVDLVQEAILAKAGDTLPRVYFPHSGVISLVVSLNEGEMVEVAMIGRDSIFGASTIHDDGFSLADAIVQLPGTASTLELARFQRAVEQSATFRSVIARHEQFLLAQAQQSAACNAFHTVEARLSRWLLRMYDLVGSEKLPLTQGFLAQMIGVRRNSVSLVANTLQQAGLIHYRRGHIEITNLDGIKETACECYETVNAHREQLLRPQ